MSRWKTQRYRLALCTPSGSACPSSLWFAISPSEFTSSSGGPQPDVCPVNEEADNRFKGTTSLARNAYPDVVIVRAAAKMLQKVVLVVMLGSSCLHMTFMGGKDVSSLSLHRLFRDDFFLHSACACAIRCFQLSNLLTR